MRDRHAFTWQSVEILNVFNTLTLKQIFWKTKTFFQNTGVPFFSWKYKIENAPLPFKTAMWEANFKTNRMATTKLAYHNKWSFASNCFIFLKILFQFKNLLSWVDLMYQDPNVHIHTFSKRWSFVWGCSFPVSILNDLVLFIDVI